MAANVRPNLLLASPWPPAKSEIARHVAEILLPALLNRYDVVPLGTQDGVAGTIPVMSVQSGLDAFADAPLLAHIGNESLQNDAALTALTRRPGVVVMHDIVLHHAWYDACMRADRFDDYLASVREYGGALLAEQALLARHHSAVVHRMARSLPLFEPFLQNAMGVVVHSQMAFDAVSERGPWPVLRLDLPTPMPASAQTVLAHRESQVQALQGGAPIRLVVFGYLGPNRCLDQILDGMAILKAQAVAVRLDVYGQLSDPPAFQQAIERAGLTQCVFVHGFVSNEALDHALQQAHLACNFRSPTMGEASASQLRLYAAGLPAIVGRTGWYAEQPDSAVVHVEPGGEAAGLVSAVMRMMHSPAELPAMAAAGLEHLQRRHDPDAYVAQLAEFLAECGQTGPSHRLGRHYVRQAASANAALQLPVTPLMAQSLVDLSGAEIDRGAIGQAFHRASLVASLEAAPSVSADPYRDIPMPAPIPPAFSGQRGESVGQHPAYSPDLAALALRAKARTELPASLQKGFLGKVGLAPWVLKAWNFLSRDWREPIELTHRVLAAHDPVIAEMRQIKAQMAQLRAESRQQTMMVRAELVATEEQVAQLSTRLQGGVQTVPGPGAPEGVSTLEGDFLQAVADHFRGDPAVLRERLAVHLPAVVQAQARVRAAESEAVGVTANVAVTPLIDLGCGRGEWLEVLRNAGHPSLGIDMAAECVSACLERGLDAKLGDALRVLQQLPDHSVAVITAFHLVEHLPLKGQITLFNEAWRVLAPGGLLLAETPNPENLGVISRNFWYDPTHLRPVPGEMLRLLAKAAGFDDVKVEFLQPPPVPSLELEHYAPRIRHMLFCGEDTVVHAVKTDPTGRESLPKGLGA
ncbi:MAG: methyltransferase domain-containing protein [Pseudomonadota bacterium]